MNTLAIVLLSISTLCTSSDVYTKKCTKLYVQCIESAMKQDSSLNFEGAYLKCLKSVE